MQIFFHGLSAVDVSSCAGLAAVQGLTVALPRVDVSRPRARGLWLAPPVLFAAAVFILAANPRSAQVLTGLAALAVPALAALAAACMARGSRPALAAAVPVMLIVILGAPDTLAGQIGTTLLCALSAVAIGALLVRLGGPLWVAAGIVVLCVADVVLVADGRVGAAAAALSQADIGGLPELSHVSLGTFTLGYGDLFVAGVAGAIAARRPGGQRRVATLTAGLMLLEAGLLAGEGPYPATVPVVVALVADELAWGVRRWRERRASGPSDGPQRSSVDGSMAYAAVDR
ncbi:hypothetical protein [Capillimicrobium parvum]|uniref:Uncharacterized protein n=1 Tax=Capillimicrobium parvum TaxID=2884022 RepID=A0A9E7C2B4_9ACTN|nr:hypothetical protein [Capillimicrobium parvum]UGS37452.1 hypothetical protein DSM104329_03868 [Capillimicrobium parvum]